MSEILRQGDKVFYVGSKYHDRLKGKVGWLHASVQDNPHAWIVEFPDTRNPKDHNDTDDFIMPATSLTKIRPAHVPAEKKEGPEVAPRRKRLATDEE